MAIIKDGRLIGWVGNDPAQIRDELRRVRISLGLEDHLDTLSQLSCILKKTVPVPSMLTAVA